MGDNRSGQRELPADRPRYLMGVGSPEDLVNAVLAGRRHVRLRPADATRPKRFVFTERPREPRRRPLPRRPRGQSKAPCDCTMCIRFSMAYVHHLFRNEELLGYRLASEPQHPLSRASHRGQVAPLSRTARCRPSRGPSSTATGSWTRRYVRTKSRAGSNSPASTSLRAARRGTELLPALRAARRP